MDRKRMGDGYVTGNQLGDILEKMGLEVAHAISDRISDQDARIETLQAEIRKLRGMVEADRRHGLGACPCRRVRGAARC